MAPRFSREFSSSPGVVDRAFVVACAAVWLLVLGMGVAAAVAFADLARGRSAGEIGSGTSWLLYAIIAVSALVIALAIPLLLRARRVATLDEELASAPVSAGPAAVADDAAAVRAVPRQTRSDLARVPVATLDRIRAAIGPPAKVAIIPEPGLQSAGGLLALPDAASWWRSRGSTSSSCGTRSTASSERPLPAVVGGRFAAYPRNSEGAQADRLRPFAIRQSRSNPASWMTAPRPARRPRARCR